MSSVLIISADPFTTEQLSAVASTFGIRARTISSIESAKEWLSMQSFDVLFLDSRFESYDPIALFELAWRYNPLMIAALFNLNGTVMNEWNARYVGARIFSGIKALEGIKSTLQALAERKELTENTLHQSILFVEDLDSPRDIICSYIEGLGYHHVEGVSNAEEALKILKANPEKYFCVITDLNMPKMNGVTLTELIRSTVDLTYLPIIVLTADATSDNLIECIKAGATGFLVKPPRKKTLRLELEKAKRMVFAKQSPWLCQPEDAHLLEDVLAKISLF